MSFKVSFEKTLTDDEEEVDDEDPRSIYVAKIHSTAMDAMVEGTSVDWRNQSTVLSLKELPGAYTPTT